MKVTPQKITVAIVTKNRPYKLSRLLKSISQLHLFPGKILVVDNDLQQTAQKICRQWELKLPLVHLGCFRVGTPHARNFALASCQTRFLCFVDDDCVLNPDWLAVLLVELNSYQPGFILGGSKLFNQDNYWARLQFHRYQTWVQSLTVGSKVLPLFFDTKNVCLDLKKIDRQKFKFDEIFSGLKTSGGEDVDFGLQLFKSGIRGHYLPEMVVWHEEVSSLLKLIKKTYEKGKLEGFLYKKWQLCHLDEKKKKDFWSKLFFVGYKSVG